MLRYLAQNADWVDSDMVVVTAVRPRVGRVSTLHQPLILSALLGRSHGR